MSLTAVRIHQPGGDRPWSDIAAFVDAAFVALYREPLPVVAVRSKTCDWRQPKHLTTTRDVFRYVEEHSLRVVRTELHGGSGRTGYDWDVYLGGAPS